MEALTKFAKSDLNLSRKEGSILIAQTKRGTLSLEHVAGIYTLKAEGEVLATGKPAVVVPVLASLYQIC